MFTKISFISSDNEVKSMVILMRRIIYVLTKVKWMKKASKSPTSIILRINMKVEVTNNQQIAWCRYYMGKIASKLIKKQWHIGWRRTVQDN